MKLLRLEICNLGPFKGTYSFDLLDKGIIHLKGKQGSGKTTILNAITLALFGEIRKGDDSISVGDIQNWYVSKNSGAYSLVEVESDGYIYRIINSRNHPIYGTAHRVDEFIEDNWELKFDRKEDTKPYIQKLLGFDYKTFTTSSYIRQKSIVSLMKSGTERKEIFIKLLGLDKKFVYIDKELKSREDEQSEKLASIKSKVDTLELSINKIKLDDVDEILDIINCASINILNKIRKNISSIVKLRKFKKQLSSIILKYESIGNELYRLKTKISSLKSRVDSNSELVKQILHSRDVELNSISSVVKEKEELETKLGLLDQKLDEYEHIKEELDKTVKLLDKYTKNFELSKKEIETIKRDIRNIENEKIIDRCDKCGQKLPEDSIEKIRIDNKNKIDKLKEELESKQEELNTFANGHLKYKEIVEKLRVLDKERIEHLTNRNSCLDRLGRLGNINEKSIITKYTLQVNSKKDEIANLKLQIAELEKDLEDKLNSENELYIELENISNGEYTAETILETGSDIVKDQLYSLERENELLFKKLNGYIFKINSITEKRDENERLMTEYNQSKGEYDILSLENRATILLRKLFKDFKSYIISTYIDNINIYMNRYLKIFGFPYSNSKFEMNNTLDWVFHNGIEWKGVENLSGGESQSLLLCGIFAFFKVLSSKSVSNYIIADEPLTGLDNEHQERLFEFLSEFKNKNVNVIISSHSSAIYDENYDETWEVTKIDNKFSEVIIY